jgi:hypothetical protein
MPSIPVPCSACGASLHLPAQVRRVACNHCGAVLTVRQEGGVTFTQVSRSSGAVAAKPPPVRRVSPAAPPNPRAGPLHLVGELSRLEDEWREEQQSYDVREGPSSSSIALTVVIGFMSIPVLVLSIFIFFNVSMEGALIWLAVFLMALVAFGLFLGLDLRRARKARAYQRAEAEYQRRRRALLERLEETEDP